MNTSHGVLIMLAMCCTPVSAFADAPSECSAQKVPASLGVVAQLQANNVPIAEPHIVTHYFYGPSHGLIALKRSLSAAGYKVNATVDEKGILAFRLEAVSNDWVNSTIPEMCRLSSKAGASYDGWDIDVSQDNIKADAK